MGSRGMCCGVVINTRADAVLRLPGGVTREPRGQTDVAERGPTLTTYSTRYSLENAYLQLEIADKRGDAAVVHFLPERLTTRYRAYLHITCQVVHVHGVVLRITKHMPALVPTPKTSPTDSTQRKG